MARLRDHGVMAIAAALTVTTGMHVHIGDDFHAQLAAHFPDLAELPSVEFDDAVSKALRVNVVVVEKLLDRAHTLTRDAQQESPALVHAVRAPVKLIDALMPELGTANQLRPASERAAQQRSK